ncbi:glycosyltransferase family A protein [Microbacterium sp. BH-3-3-3]|uniref:glycosyltransferase family 2 protein n=1 Tax=Microbacterium sp. BH-3-3-3 TaxID=1906742 RepID=UPI0009F36091|nr:glycosyltransferase family A protein [Microbacterium sp. BH-3-3-3]
MHTVPTPLLSVIVPAYNADAYLARALDPLCDASTRTIEVIVVDDGSTDATGVLADTYAAARPDLVRVVHQRNGGHGAAIEAGIAIARGEYVKVLDADDWLDTSALLSVLATLRDLARGGGVDALFTDFVYDRAGKSNRVSRFDTVFPSDRRFGWEQTERFGKRQHLMMHAIIYRTSLLRASELALPRHTFYVDNLYVVRPLLHVRTMYYLPVQLYHYFIGRAGQSVDVNVMLARVDQQLLVNKLALGALPPAADVAAGSVPVQLYAALLHYVEALCAVTSATLARGGDDTHLAKRDAFWSHVKHENPWVHTRMRRSFMGTSSNLPGGAGRRVTSLAYHVARRVVGFS